MHIPPHVCQVWVIGPWVQGPSVKLVAPPQNSFLNPEGWRKHLPRTQENYEYIIQGVTEGFHIVTSLDFQPAEVDNYSSATNPLIKHQVESQIKTEIIEGRYIKVQEKPCIVSALGAIPKPKGGIRIIHDGSKPTGKALNDYADLDQKLRYQSLDDAVDCLSPNAFMAKVDLKSAYRSVRVHRSNWPACGLK